MEPYAGALEDTVRGDTVVETHQDREVGGRWEQTPRRTIKFHQIVGVGK